ncbi:MAG: restriction endonuclease subunit S [Bifidobacterium crudilactis]|nr:restriction endonuclease subunit S [Bifidobacterium crudilactis]
MTGGDIAQVKGGKRLPAGYFVQKTPTPFPYIRVSDMVNGGIRESGIKYVPEAAAAAIRNYRIGKDDIFISVAGTLGLVGRIPGHLDGANLTENADRLTQIKCDIDFLMYYLLSEPIQNEIDAIRTVGAQPKLALGRIKSFEVRLPSATDEQRRIASALREADGLISALERLIEKKREIKQGLMQELLTGRTRLPGFSGRWRSVTLGDVVRIHRGSMLTRAQAGKGRVPVIAGGKTPAGNTDRPNRTGRTITISASGASAGYVAIYDGPIFASDCSTISDSKTFDLDFIYYSLLLRQDAIYRAQTGGAQPHIHAKDVYPMGVQMPTSIDEQSAISRVLRDVDDEIAALERRLESARAIRQGMMQELLTGRTRLVDEVAG